MARAAAHGALPPSNSNYTTFAVPGSMFPEIALFSQFGQLFPQYNELSNQLQSQKGNGAEEVKAGLMGRGPGGNGGGRTRSSDSRTSSAYASRHQAAEQRRRTRINERLELLRQLVPHAERANTACFLEEVIKYVDSLKRRNAELEAAIGSKPAPTELPTQPIAAIAASLNKPLTTTTQSTPGQGPPQPSLSQGQQQPQLSHPPVQQHHHSGSMGEPPSHQHHHPHPQPHPQQDVKSLSLFPSSSGAAPPSKRAFLSLSEEPNHMAFAQLQQQILGHDKVPASSPAPGAAAPAHDGHTVAALDLRKPAAASGDSPVSSEESGVPLKKRKMLVL